MTKRRLMVIYQFEKREEYDHFLTDQEINHIGLKMAKEKGIQFVGFEDKMIRSLK